VRNPGLARDFGRCSPILFRSNIHADFGYYFLPSKPALLSARMQLLQLLWKLIQTYFHYRKGVEAIRTGKGASHSQDVMMKAYLKGDYQTAFFRAIDPFFKGTMMMQMGQFGPAEQILQHVAAGSKEPRTGAIANSVLGQVLVEEKQYDRAMECFRTARILWQERGFPERRMAELWLRRGGNSAEALQLARRGLEKEQTFEGLSPDSKNMNLRETTATLAWAVAVESHDTAEVDQLLAEALRIPAVDHPVDTTALMHLHFGYAYAALGDMDKSIHHLDEAARIDPNGLAGRAAKTPVTAAS
jgi:tetratricopeptide (TPR) repeat protein